ncbi:fructosamine kinase family protein [Marinilabiliaceae bacterium ANBcel2]|nr:fructosamine kinase family protein [Marinilabiliaceae bacterium ANBcel2]
MISKESLENILGERITGFSSMGGGCIADTQKIDTDGGLSYIVKQGGASDMFIKEAAGLKELAKPAVIRVPKVVAFDNDYLVIEYIDSKGRMPNFFEKFGEQFALLHKYKGERFGFDDDNYLGHTPQPNIPRGEEAFSWLQFYKNKRLIYQYELANQNGYVDKKFSSLFNNLIDQLPQILSGSEEEPSLLHGDLWGGNYMTGERGEPVIIDPAVYYGHREADLAMTKLFGGFTAEFYNSYNKTYPLKDGYEYREGIYLLYHVLNHLNLFGRGYYSQAISLMQRYS